MIAFINGTLCEKGVDRIIIENQGMGYSIFVPQTVIDHMPPTGTRVKVYTYLYVKEDVIGLYGFLSRDDLETFKLLITVNGIGPKGALGILSVMNADDLRFAVLAGDEKTISKAPGIGKKTAQKLIIELKDKLDFETALEHKLTPGDAVNMGTSDARDEAVMALAALGYSQAEALRAVRLCDVTESMTTDEILKLALKKLLTF